MKLRLWAILALLLSVSAVPAHSQALVVATCGTLASPLPTGSGGQPLFTNPQGQLCTAASVSASITGFAPATTGTPISVTTSGVTGTLPAGAVVVASNVGTTNNAYCKLGASATTSDQLIAPNSWFAFTVGASTQLTCITSTSTTTVNMVGGSGLPTGAGGGGGGSGGGGSVTQGTSPWIVAGGGTAGVAAAGVVTVQGISSMTPLLSSQSGTWTVQPGNTANSTPWLVGHSASTGVTCGSNVSSCVLKASAGNLNGVYAECTSACWLMVFNSTSAPANGATTAGIANGNLVECIDIAANSSKSLNYATYPRPFSVGITAVISSTACATLTLSTVGFVSGTTL